jgi:hypothetical protein
MTVEDELAFILIVAAMKFLQVTLACMSFHQMYDQLDITLLTYSKCAASYRQSSHSCENISIPSYADHLLFLRRNAFTLQVMIRRYKALPTFAMTWPSLVPFTTPDSGSTYTSFITRTSNALSLPSLVSLVQRTRPIHMGRISRFVCVATVVRNMVSCDYPGWNIGLVCVMKA